MSAEFEPSASAAAASVADVAPAEAAAAGASFEDKRAAQEERVKSTNYRQMKANSTSSVFAQSSLTEPDVDELILRYSVMPALRPRPQAFFFRSFARIQLSFSCSAYLSFVFCPLLGFRAFFGVGVSHHSLSP